MEAHEEELVTEETKLRDKRHHIKVMGFKAWLRRERQKALEKLPNEFRWQILESNDNFNYSGDFNESNFGNAC